MTLRAKLVLSNLLMGVAPVVVLVVVATTFSGIMQDESRAERHGSPHFFETMIRSPNFRDAVHRAFVVTQRINVLSLSPQGLPADPAIFQKWDQELATANAGLVVRQEGRLFVMGRLLKGHKLPPLPIFGSFRPPRSIHSPFKIIGNLNFRFSDGTPGAVTVLWNSSNWDKELHTFTFWLIFTFSMTLLVLDTLFTGLILREVLNPLERLRQAAERIADGRLEPPEDSRRRQDEWTPLFTSFETMRRTLAANRELALSYEADRKELISHIAHDLRTPITAIGGYARGILEGVANTEEKRRNYLEIISTKARDLERMAQELFFLSNLDRNAVPYDFQRINVRAFLADSAEELSLDGSRRGLTLTVAKLPPETIFVQADVTKLRTVFVNLAENALKFKRGDSVTWTWKSWVEEPYVKISLADTGKGISAEALPKIFTSFYREDAARTSSIPGTGLGLAIVQRIMNDHHGRVTVSSILGTGSEFTLWLPLAPLFPDKEDE